MIVAWIQTYALRLSAIVLAVAVGMAVVQTWRLAKEQASFAGYKVQVVELQAKRERNYSADLKASRDATDALQHTINQNQRLQNERIQAINDRHAAVVTGLRNRPEARAASVSPTPNTTGNPEGATGLQLSGPDGRFLAGEAARGDALRASLQTCYKNYEAAAEVLKTYGEGLPK